MHAVLDLMIYAGSILMVYNIWRCYGFVRQMRHVESWNRSRLLLYVPLALLIMFLIGYLAVGLFGDPDFIVAGILFGGSVFVFLVMGILYDVIDRLRQAIDDSKGQYAGVRDDLQKLANDYMSVMRINLSHDKIEELSGNRLYQSDNDASTYSELLSMRREHIIYGPLLHMGEGVLTRDELLKAFERGHTQVEELLLCRVDDEYTGFVRVRVTLTRRPATHDVIALLTEQPCNDEFVREVILSKALIEQFDMITYLIDGRYRVLIGDKSANRQGSIFPKSTTGEYARYLEEQVAPVVRGTKEERDALLRALSPERVELELATREPYEVNISCNIDGGVFYKRFVFYVVNREAKFYLLLKSDTTMARREETERNKRLSTALEEAQRASKAKTTFLSNMSHDIRTPMNAIVGYTEFAKKCESIDKTHEYLSKIEASSKYLLALINDVLEMSRIESGKLELEKDDVNLRTMMGGLKNMFESQMAEKGILFEVRMEDVRDSLVRTDETRLNRVLLNLLSNAYKFTPGGGSVTVTFAQHADAAQGYGSYELRVSDTGIGMAPEFASKVFDAFERERNTTASGIQGTGLGMAISKRIVDMMGGTIEVFSKPGAGTEFVVRLVLELAKQAPSESVEEPTPSEDAFVDFEGMRVLLAEDNEINREIASMLLEELGFVVEEAKDGQEAVNKLVDAGADHFDVVITDIQMPVMNGYEEAKAIRALPDPQLSNVPIVAMSANAFKEDVDAAMEVGMNGYVPKPVDVGVIMDELTRVLS